MKYRLVNQPRVCCTELGKPSWTGDRDHSIQPQPLPQIPENSTKDVCFLCSCAQTTCRHVPLSDAYRTHVIVSAKAEPVKQTESVRDSWQVDCFLCFYGTKTVQSHPHMCIVDWPWSHSLLDLCPLHSHINTHTYWLLLCFNQLFSLSYLIHCITSNLWQICNQISTVNFTFTMASTS